VNNPSRAGYVAFATLITDASAIIRGANMRLLLIILLIIILFGGGLGLHGGLFVGTSGLYYGGGVGLALLVILVLLIL
jgi:hypothetical protein